METSKLIGLILLGVVIWAGGVWIIRLVWLG